MSAYLNLLLYQMNVILLTDDAQAESQRYFTVPPVSRERDTRYSMTEGRSESRVDDIIRVYNGQAIPK
jgi:hypothetical protein